MNHIKDYWRESEVFHASNLNEIARAINELIDKAETSIIDDRQSSSESTYSSVKIIELLEDYGFKTVVVDELPVVGKSNTVYFVPSANPKEKDVMDEFIWCDGKWEQIGSTRVDFSNYYTKREIDDTVNVIDGMISDKADVIHEHQMEDVSGLTGALSGKADADHTHTMADINGLSNALAGKSDTSHTHQMNDVSGLTKALDEFSEAVSSHINEIEDTLKGKQDTLIAGSGITISGNTISSYGGNVNDVQIDTITIIDGNGNANINLGTNLSFNRSTKTLNVIEPEIVVEHVELQLSVNYGSVDFSGRTIIVTYEGSSHSIELDENGECSFDVTLGSFYTVKYPSFLYYSNMPDSSYIAVKPFRTLIKTYSYLGNAIRSVKLQQSNPVTWTTSGDSMVIDSILNQYGTYVIDEENKKYAKLNSGNHTYFEDGTAWDGSYGNSFRRIPTVYYYVTSDDNNQPILKISPNDIGGHSWEEAWIGTYKGSIVGNKLRSIPGATTTQSTTMSNFWNAAQQNSIDYGLVNYFQHCMLLGLHYAKFGTSQSETTMGPGLQNAGSGYYTHITGYSKELGDGTGSMPYAGYATLTMNKLFGIEDLAGSTWEFRPNIRFSGSGAIATVYEGNIVSNTASGRTFQKLSSASQAYITEMALGEYCDFIPKTVGGTSSTYYCDGTWASSSGELLLVGGDSAHGSLCGLSAATSNGAFSISDADIGARLAFYGDISNYTLVSGQELNSLHSN